MIQYLKHNQIDKIKWDNCIEKSFNRLPYAFSWYLDIVSSNWDALVYDDYLAVMPLTHRKKYGILYLFQPVLSQQLGVFSTLEKKLFNIDTFIEAIPERFKLIEISINSMNSVTEGFKNIQTVKRNNFILSLKEEYEIIQQGYSKNHKKNIKKFIETVTNPEIKKTTYSEFYQFKLGFINKWNNRFSKNSKNDYQNILKKLEYSGKMESFLIYDNQKILLAGICYIYINEMVTIQTFLTDSGRKSGVLYFIIDQFIKENATKNLNLDFMGSIIPGVAYWNQGFGSTESHYEFIKMIRLPRIINFLVKLRQKR
jgi:hypothetical protein